jgi:hypothetical protein
VLNKETHNPIPDATVTYNGNVLVQNTDANGIVFLNDVFFISPESGVVVSASAFHYTANTQRQSYRLLEERNYNIVFLLQPIEFAQKLKLPEKAEDLPAAATLQHGKTTSQLSIPFQSLVNERGEEVKGEIDVEMTFYDAGDFPPDYMSDDPTLPTLLAQTDDSGIVRLQTTGMADINLYQEGQRLQVAPNRSVLWTIQEPDETAQIIASLPEDNPVKLYKLNTATNFWEENAEPCIYDANTQTLRVNLTHLSHNNTDFEFPSFGTCYEGSIVDQCGDSIPEQTLFLTFIGNNYGESGIEATRLARQRLRQGGQFSYRELKTNSQGRYCSNAPLFAYAKDLIAYGSVYAYPRIADKKRISLGICDCPNCLKDDETQELLPSLNCYEPSRSIMDRTRTLRPAPEEGDSDGRDGGNFFRDATYARISNYCSKKLYNQTDLTKDTPPNKNAIPVGAYQQACLNTFLQKNPSQKCQACPSHYNAVQHFTYSINDPNRASKEKDPNANFYRNCSGKKPGGHRCAQLPMVKITLPWKSCPADNICIPSMNKSCENTAECRAGLICLHNKCTCIDKNNCNIISCNHVNDCTTKLGGYIKDLSTGIKGFKCLHEICVPEEY